MDASDLSPAHWPAEPSLEWGAAGDGALALAQTPARAPALALALILALALPLTLSLARNQTLART